MVKSNKKQLSTGKALCLGITLGIMFVVFFTLFSFLFSNETELEEYADCVEDCSFDMRNCAFFLIVYTKDYKGYLPLENYKNCELELESCLYDCKP